MTAKPAKYWCPRQDLNLHATKAGDFKSLASHMISTA